MSSLVLASASPRRLQLLEQVGLQAIVIPAQIDETPHPQESITTLVQRLAESKAKKIADQLERESVANTCRLVLAADTMVVLDDQLLGKPKDRDDALRMLALLSNRTHQVATGVCVNNGGKKQSTVVHTDVSMGVISPDLAARYWESGEPVGKAGSYAIQGRGAMFVETINGSYSNVIGLPLFETVAMLRNAELTPFNERSGTLDYT